MVSFAAHKSVRSSLLTALIFSIVLRVAFGMSRMLTDKLCSLSQQAKNIRFKLNVNDSVHL